MSNTCSRTEGETNPNVLPVQLEEEMNLRRTLTTKVEPGEPKGQAEAKHQEAGAGNKVVLSLGTPPWHLSAEHRARRLAPINTCSS